MEVIFLNEHLQELYTSGKSSKYKKIPAQVVRKFPLTVRILQQIKVIQYVWKFPGYNFEKLKGKNQYSMRDGQNMATDYGN